MNEQNTASVLILCVTQSQHIDKAVGKIKTNVMPLTLK